MIRYVSINIFHHSRQPVPQATCCHPRPSKSNYIVKKPGNSWHFVRTANRYFEVSYNVLPFTLMAVHDLSGPIGKAGASHAEGCRVDSRLRCTDLYYARGAHGVLPMHEDAGATSQ